MVKEAIQQMEKEVESYTSYLQVKIREKDWHAVSDAANDLREIQAKIDILKQINPTPLPQSNSVKGKWPTIGDVFKDITLGSRPT